MTNLLIPLEEIVLDYRDRFSVITEATDDGKQRKYLEGIFAQSEIINGNKRWYQKDEMYKEACRFNSDIIPKRKALGELDHSTDRQTLLHRTALIYETPLEMRENNLYGKARVLETQYGQTLSILIDEKVPFGVSTKGSGELSKIKKENQSVNLVTNFTMSSPGDVVANPSAPNAIPKLIMEMLMEQDKRIERIWSIEITDEVRKKIHKINKSRLMESFKNEYDKLIRGK